MRPLPDVLPTTTVGSFPKPPYLVKARSSHARGDITQSELDRLAREATEFWVRRQEELDIDLVVDGEMYRGDMATFFAEHVDGNTISGLVRSYGNRYYKKPIIVGRLKRKAPITVEWFQYAQSLTDRPLLGMLTGPYTMMDWSFDEHYGSRRDAALAWAEVVHEEAADLAAAGARYIQIDEPALSVRPEELPLGVESMKIAVDGLACKTVTHICYGAFDKIYPGVLQMPVNRIDLEMSNSDADLLERFAVHPFTKELGMGVIDVHSHRIEEKEQVKALIRAALAHVPPDRLYIDPDCGLKTRTVDEALAKLKVMVEAVKEIRAELRSAA